LHEFSEIGAGNMDKRDEFFTQQHKRLLNIATWSKYLAWVILVVYFFWAIGTYFQEQNYFLYYRGNFNQTYRDFMDLLRDTPSYGFSVFIELVGVFLKGVVYFLVLKGISLGLNMIVETDINYREQKGGAE
jgi:hypothetical protein